MPISKDRKQVLRNYRDKLIDGKIRAQEARDAAILTLCGGALGISFAFVDHFVKGEPRLPAFLFLAWSSWALGLVLHVLNYHFGEKAFDWQIEQTDNELAGEKINESLINKADNRVTSINNIVIALFVIGVISLGAFVSENYRVNLENVCQTQQQCDFVKRANITVQNIGRK